MSASVLVSLVLVFFLFFVERDMNVFGSNLPMKFIGWVIYVITGVWVVKATLVISMYISHKFPHVSAGITLIGFFGLIGLYLREILT